MDTLKVKWFFCEQCSTLPAHLITISSSSVFAPKLALKRQLLPSYSSSRTPSKSKIFYWNASPFIITTTLVCCMVARHNHIIVLKSSVYFAKTVIHSDYTFHTIYVLPFDVNKVLFLKSFHFRATHTYSSIICESQKICPKSLNLTKRFKIYQDKDFMDKETFSNTQVAWLTHRNIAVKVWDLFCGNSLAQHLSSFVHILEPHFLLCLLPRTLTKFSDLTLLLLTNKDESPSWVLLPIISNNSFVMEMTERSIQACLAL